MSILRGLFKRTKKETKEEDQFIGDDLPKMSEEEELTKLKEQLKTKTEKFNVQKELSETKAKLKAFEAPTKSEVRLAQAKKIGLGVANFSKTVYGGIQKVRQVSVQHRKNQIQTLQQRATINKLTQKAYGVNMA